MSAEKLWDRTEENRLRAEVARLKAELGERLARCAECMGGKRNISPRNWGDVCALEVQLAAARAALERIDTGDKGTWSCRCPACDIARAALKGGGA